MKKKGYRPDKIEVMHPSVQQYFTLLTSNVTISTQGTIHDQSMSKVASM